MASRLRHHLRRADVRPAGTDAEDKLITAHDESQTTMLRLTYNQGPYMWASITGFENIFGNGGLSIKMLVLRLPH